MNKNMTPYKQDCRSLKYFMYNSNSSSGASSI